MINIYKVLIISLLTLIATTTYGQVATIHGTLTDSTDASPVFTATVAADTKTADFTDASGKFKLVVKPGTYNVTVFLLGYKKKTITVTVADGEDKTLDIAIAKDNKTLGTVVVTDGQYEKRISDVIASIDVVKDYIIKNNASQSLSDVVARTPGVTVIDGQANIRGGSGYAYGVGSRVTLLVDNMPLVRGDWGDLNWNFVPLENAEQVEVVKGAASVLYGSSALNGVINVRTAWPTDTVPETKVQVFSGIYFNPKREELRWWPRSHSPNFVGSFFNHKSKIKNVDLVIGGNFNQLTSYMQSNDNQQFRLNTKMRVHSKKIPGLIWGVNANIMYNQYDRMIFWANADAGAYQPFGGTSGGSSVTSNEQYYNINIDPNITYVGKNGARHILRMRYYNVTLLRNENFDNYNNQFYGEYQFQKRTTKEWVFTTGLQGSLGYTQSTVIGDAKARTYYGGIYAQVEKKLWNRVSVIGGVRYEVNVFTPPQSITGLDKPPVSIPDFSIPVFRLGANYGINEYNNLRASWGQGFRSPSVVERFVTGSIGPVEFFANPKIKPEYGWNAELAYKRMFHADKFQGYFDFALFWNEYHNVTEFVFNLYEVTDPSTNTTSLKPGFKNLNRERSRIAGFEISGNGEWLINEKQSFRFFGGYTYYYPGDLSGDTLQRNIKRYLANAATAFAHPDSVLNSMLTYRMNHSLRLDLEYQIGRFKIGTTLTYNSFMNKIDIAFNTLIPGLSDYRAKNNTGKCIVDARFIFDLKHHNSLGIVARNIFNTEYSMRPGIMEAPGSFTIQYTHKF